MKFKKIQRPEVGIEYEGAIGFVEALIAICKVGIRRTEFIVKINDHTFAKEKCFVIPKYKLIKREKDKNI